MLALVSEVAEHDVVFDHKKPLALCDVCTESKTEALISFRGARSVFDLANVCA